MSKTTSQQGPSFTEMVEAVQEAHDLTTQKVTADFLGCGRSTLGTALRKGSASDALTETVQKAFEALSQGEGDEEKKFTREGKLEDELPSDYSRRMIRKGYDNATIREQLRDQFPGYGAWKIAPAVYRRELRKAGEDV